jgi:hypothetical protein
MGGGSVSARKVQSAQARASWPEALPLRTLDQPIAAPCLPTMPPFHINPRVSAPGSRFVEDHAATPGKSHLCVDTSELCVDATSQCFDTFVSCVDTSRQCLDAWRRRLDTFEPRLDISQQCLDTSELCVDTSWQCLDTSKLCSNTSSQCLGTQQPRKDVMARRWDSWPSQTDFLRRRRPKLADLHCLRPQSLHRSAKRRRSARQARVVLMFR